MDRTVWQDHLLSVSRLFVEHTKHFMQRNGIKIDNRSSNDSKEKFMGPRIKNLDSCDSESDSEGK